MVDIVVLPMWFQTPSAPSVLSLTPPFGDPVLSAVVGCKHPTLHLSGSGRASGEKAVSGSFQQSFLASTIVSAFCECIWDES